MRAELLEKVRVDALSDEPILFEVDAEEGEVDEVRVVLEPTAGELSGHLAHVVGTATRDGETWAFDAFVEVAEVVTDRRAIVPIDGALVEGEELELVVDPRPWLDGVAFDRLGVCESSCAFEAGSQAAQAASLGVRSPHGFHVSLETP